jgi:Family of unknown function (DUF6464)/Pentapeptide repeats (9 copies)
MKKATIKNEALEEIASFDGTMPLGYLTIFIAIFAASIIGVAFGFDKIFKANIRPEAYAGAAALATGFALVGEAIILVDKRGGKRIERHTFYDLKITELPKIDIEDCYFEDCTFDVDLSEVVLKGCSFTECKFKSKIGRSVEDCSFRYCDFSGATVDQGFYLRHVIRGCDFSEAKTRAEYPHSNIDTNYPRDGWIGWLSCDHNARSPFLCCAINPLGPCNECPDFVRPPIFMNARDVFLGLPRRLRRNEHEYEWFEGDGIFDPAYDKCANRLAHGLIEGDLIDKELYEVCVVFEDFLEDAEDETPEGEALAILREVIRTYEKTHGTI